MANLFNSYTSLNGTSAETLAKYNALTEEGNKQSLIFDTKRKSIWAKGVEYGYVDMTAIASQTSGNSNSSIFKGTCSTAAGTAVKVVDCPDFTTADLVKGALIFVTFSTTNSAAVANLKLNVNSTGEKPLKYIYNSSSPANLNAVGQIRANQTLLFAYDDTNWVCLTLNYNTNTTYSAMTEALYKAGTSTTNYLVSPSIFKNGTAYWVGKKLTFDILSSSGGTSGTQQTGIFNRTSDDVQNPYLTLKSDAFEDSSFLVADSIQLYSNVSNGVNFNYDDDRIEFNFSPLLSINSSHPTTNISSKTFSYVGGISINNSTGQISYNLGKVTISNTDYVLISTSATINQALSWDTHYDFNNALTSANTVTFTIASNATDGRNNIMINFTTGANVPNINFPSTIVWENNIPIELLPNAQYEIGISYDKQSGKHTAIWGIYGQSASSISGSGSGSSGSGSSTLAGLSDVQLSSPSSGQSLVYNGTKWVNQTVSGGSSGNQKWATSNLGRTDASDSTNFAYIAGIKLEYNSSTSTYTLSYSYGIVAQAAANIPDEYSLVVGSKTSTTNTATTTSAASYINLIKTTELGASSVASSIWIKNGTNTTVQTAATGYIQINSTASGSDSNIYYYVTGNLINTNNASDTSNPTTYTTASEAYIKLVNGETISAPIRLKGLLGTYITALNDTTYISSYKIVPSLSSGTAIATITYPGTNGASQTATLNAPSQASYSFASSITSTNGIKIATVTYNSSTTYDLYTPKIYTYFGASASSSSNATSGSGTAYLNSVFAGNSSVLSSLQIKAGTGISLAYANGALTITNSSTPSANYINIASSAGQQTFSIQSTSGTNTARFVTHSTGTNQVYNIEVASSPGSDTNTLYIVV